jgi:hypothetical protein
MTPEAKIISRGREGNIARGREGERGAALVTALLVSLLLLAAGGSLIYTTGMSASNAVDATAEAQAYYAAEAGLQSAMSVLRGNVAPRSGLNLPVGTKVKNNFRAANLPALSNLPSDAATDARMSGWLPYNGTTTGSRVPLDSAASNQLFFQLSISDPDDPNRTALLANPTYVPSRLLITSTGYGPKGSIKQMKMLVNQSYFDFTARSTLLMRGAEDCSDMATFEIGDSNAKDYNGNDGAIPPKPALPVFGTTCPANATQATNTVNGSKPNTVTSNPQGKVADIPNSDLAAWLQDANTARALLLDLAAQGQSTGRYFTGTPSDLGSSSDPKFTFVDGNCSMGSGAGLLVVTGTLTMSGNAGFDGVILVLGDGVLVRNGGGNGDILGAMVVAKFARTWPAAENIQPHPFLAPTFNTNGGGNSNVQYNSTNVNNAMNLLGNRLMGIVEN